MILSLRQGQRFMKLLFMLLIYCAREFDMDGFEDLDEPGLEDLFQVYALIWGPDGRRDLVGQYVQENPDRLKWADLKDVSSWDQGLFGRFQVMRQGADVFYIAGGYAFAVRGQIDEADSEDGFVLDYVESLVLPFDGVITYGIFARDLSRSPEALSASARLELLARCKGDGHIVRGARQFVRPAAVVREHFDKMEPVGPDEVDRFPTRELHAGPLAGLSWEERLKAVDDDVKAENHDELMRQAVERADECAVRGRPAHTYAELLSRYDKDYLLMLADHFEADFTRKMGKQKLIAAILEVMPVDAESLLGPAIMEGTDELERVRRVFEAGGRIDVSEDDPDAYDQLPLRSYPAVSIFRIPGGHAAAMVDEAIEALSTADFDHLARRAAYCDRACRYAMLACEFRGVVPLADVLVECVRDLGIEENPFLLVYAFKERQGRDDHCEFVELDGESYLVAPFLAGLCDPDDFTEGSQTIMYQVLDSHEDNDPRQIVKIFQDGNYGSLWEYLLDQRSFQALAAYFDAHIPEGESDLHFADGLLEAICSYLCGIAPDLMDRDFLFELMQRSGLTVPEEDMEEVNAMLDDLIAMVPNWFENGWPIKGRRLRLV